MMFKKGSFEIGATVYPVAIKVSIPPYTQAVAQQPGPRPWGSAVLQEGLEGNLEPQEGARLSGALLPLQYDPQFGDAFWNSSKYGMVTYLLRMMTSWAIVCSVWYLPPMTRQVSWVMLGSLICCLCCSLLLLNHSSLPQPEEDAVQFANRVKSAIARQGGLVDLLW